MSKIQIIYEIIFVFSGVDIPALLRSISISESIIDNLKDSKMGHLAISYMCYKVMTPVRYMLTVGKYLLRYSQSTTFKRVKYKIFFSGGTTVSIKYLSQWGYIKPIPSKERLRKIYDDKKAQIKQGYEDLQDKATSAMSKENKK